MQSASKQVVQKKQLIFNGNNPPSSYHLPFF